jgi:hypothetical protein
MKTMTKISEEIRNGISGQAMVLTVVMLGGMMLSATAVAGLLMFYQLRQANDISSSGAAVFAADAGLEAGSYCYFYQNVFLPGQVPQPSVKYCVIGSSDFSNGASYKSSLVFSFEGGFDPQNVTGFIQDSYGFSNKTERALQNTFSNRL